MKPCKGPVISPQCHGAVLVVGESAVQLVEYHLSQASLEGSFPS